jgi:hypothetical protein
MIITMIVTLVKNSRAVIAFALQCFLARLAYRDARS